MAGSSPPRRQSYYLAAGSPQRNVLEEILGDDRNSEARHRYLLETAKREHDRVREEAERVYREQLQREERQRLLDARRKEEERIKLEEALAADRARLNELKAKKIAIPAPLPDPEPPVIVAPAVNGKVPAVPPPINNAPAQTNGTTSQKPTTIPAVPKLPSAPVPAQTQSQTPATAPHKAPEPSKTVNSVLGINGLLNNTPQPNGAASNPETSRSAAQPPTQTRPDKYVEIHKNLKMLRKSMADQAKSNPALKGRMGDMRREILQSELMDPSRFVLEPRNPAEGAAHNDATLPSIFLYLINIFAKAAIAQFINEAGARPETADPVGVCVAATLSEPDFLWRGSSLIDIMLAKFRIVCPVLFGYRGSEKTEQGRQRLGWWKDGGQWVPEQQHMDRMTGLGAGFASISLRNFAMSKKTNPFPPRVYWTAMARIVNTPHAEISDTQCVVLKAMVENYEQKFIEFYGTAAIAALRTALVDFPSRVPQKSAAVNSLEVLAQMLKRNTGLVLG
ncbi:hypothetical protein CHGG_07708 [Chaetomium globosum CBS 148.51]|uniref:mRNA export factor GLE1 n=1 Tax=Chaetomium globosum (strain ATCC 6205 / CBS 148.51 / DSM 1962 / NBRC 6347 / NRRL 1970) TaxID=306901 RepID=Q2GWE6_CHAGB|nr:uncharacterized protein CHGG_07708 [Chaetomium globosum CBS 148.51]EAQ86455.1 hypothetical protein CHGG_07708 [Chaetomium globosum CBS 148.51]